VAYFLAPFRSFPRARRLIERLGIPAGGLFATSRQLEDVAPEDGDIGRPIATPPDLVDAGLREEVRSARVDAASPALLRYLRARLGTADKEQLHVIYTGLDDRFLKDETLTLGSPAEITTRMAVLFRRVLNLRASGILLAHNHPSGICRPSTRDIASTKKLRKVAESLDVKLLDHLVVTGSGVFSILQGKML
jgi:DNA repair protein RadC